MKGGPSMHLTDAAGLRGPSAPKRADAQDGALGPSGIANGSSKRSLCASPIALGMPSSSPVSAPTSFQPSFSQPVLPCAQPQLIRCGDSAREVWPQHWGITLSQCRGLMEECKQDPAWRRTNTVHTLVEDFVKPRTSGTGLGYALLRNRDAPLEVGIMVSHTWAENAEDFFQTLERSVGPNEVMFICALSLYQNEDGAGPSIAQQLGATPAESPFGKVLDHILQRGSEAGWRWVWRPWLHFVPKICLTISLFLYYCTMGRAKCIPMFAGQCAVGSLVDNDAVERDYIGNICIYPRWKWAYVPLDPACQAMQHTALALFLLSVLLFVTEGRWSSFQGRMVAVPNGQCDLYSRLWCVYEVFVATSRGVPMELAKTLAPAGQCRASDAVCSSMDDMVRIRREIEAWGHSKTRQSFGSGASILGHAVSGFRRAASHISLKQSAPKSAVVAAPRNAAYATVDGAIGLVTMRAHRSVLCSLVSWILPFSVLAMAQPKGDFLTPTQFFGTVVCTGVQSVILVGVTLVVVAFSLARTAHGRPSLARMLTASGIFVALGASLRVYDIFLGPKDYPPVHHCFTMNLVSAGTSLGVLSLGARVMGSSFVQFRWRMHLMVLLGTVALFMLVLTRVTSFSAGQIIPMVIWYASFRLMPIVGYPAFLWSAAARWGVAVGGDLSAPTRRASLIEVCAI